MSTNENEMPTRGFQPPSAVPDEDQQNELEIKAGLRELERMDLQIKGYTDKINELTDARNQAYGYERSIKAELELRRTKQQK